MNKATRISIIVVTYSSERDRNGNTYHWARFYSPTRGRDISVACEVGAEGNANGTACDLANGWAGTLCMQSVLPYREWQRSRPDGLRYEGDKTVLRDLRALMPRSHHAAIDKSRQRRA